jgi:hypothetical protein
LVNVADEPRDHWSSEEDLHGTWDAMLREFPEKMEAIIQRELDCMEKAMPDLRSDFQHTLLLFEEHPS